MGTVDLGGILKFDIDPGLIFIILMVMCGVLGAAGVYHYLYLGNIHPKRKFRIVSRRGQHDREYRLFWGKIVTDFNIWQLMLGRIPHGFHIKNFTKDYCEGKRFGVLPTFEERFIGQSIEGRLFPFPMNFGTKTFTIFKCSNEKCAFSDVKTFFESIEIGKQYYSINSKKQWICPKCGGEMVDEPIVLENTYVHSLKFTPELETRFIYINRADRENHLKKIPLMEYASMYDVASEIADEFTMSDREVQSFNDKSNPFMSVLLAAAPLVIPILAFGVAVYIMFMGGGNQMLEVMKIGVSISKNLALAQGVPLNQTFG